MSDTTIKTIWWIAVVSLGLNPVLIGFSLVASRRWRQHRRLASLIVVTATTGLLVVGLSYLCFIAGIGPSPPPPSTNPLAALGYLTELREFYTPPMLLASCLGGMALWLFTLLAYRIVRRHKSAPLDAF